MEGVWTDEAQDTETNASAYDFDVLISLYGDIDLSEFEYPDEPLDHTVSAQEPSLAPPRD
jgi:hypothetical protein